MKYALRLCSEHNKQKACVHIYSTMGLFEEAVDLSLKVIRIQPYFTPTLYKTLKPFAPMSD